MLPAISAASPAVLEVQKMSRAPRRSLLLATALALTLVLPASVSASHSWGNYHWARTSNPFTLKLGNKVDSTWYPYLSTTSTDWSVSGVLDTTIVPGTAVKKLCSATLGTVQVCNSRYGNNGWLGVAQIWASGSHITKATVKVNDTYFNTATYNTPAWRQMVMCQEVGHTFGLGHQDETFGNPDLTDAAGVESCMDYTSNPAGNEQPNQHDYDQLATIYGHLDTTTTVASVQAASAASAAAGRPWAWARASSPSWGSTASRSRTSSWPAEAPRGR